MWKRDFDIFIDLRLSCKKGMNGAWIMQGNVFTTDYVNLAVKRRVKDIYLQLYVVCGQAEI